MAHYNPKAMPRARRVVDETEAGAEPRCVKLACWDSGESVHEATGFYPAGDSPHAVPSCVKHKPVGRKLRMPLTIDFCWEA